MPRFANLKGSMNPFDNNKPVLSSSERLKNKRNKTIYQTQKLNYQTTKNCGNRNVKYYDNGTVRSTNSYKMNMKLSRGAVLCEDCEGNGTLCENIFDKNDLTKITMGNNVLSTLNLESGLVGTGGLSGGTQVSKNTIITTDISGVWGGSATDISKSLIGPNATLPFPSTIPTPYGYANNLINVPRNLDGSGIIIDPSNVLFPMDDNCNSRTIPNYLKLASIKTFIIYEGPLSAGTGNQITNASQAVSSNPSSPHFFAQYIGYFCTFTFSFAAVSVANAAPTGQIIKICPLGETLMNDTLFGPPSQPGGSIFKVDTFRVYIEITYFGNTPLWQGNVYPSADKNNFTPQFKPNTISTFVVNGYTPIVTHPITLAFSIYSDWASNYSSAFGVPPWLKTGGGIEMNVTIDQNNVDTCGISQLRGNNTKQNYMSCLEDKTRKINFTT